MAKRKTPTTDPGEIRNPVKAAMLMAYGYLPYRVTRRADGVRCVFFHATEEFLKDSAAYDKNDLLVPGKRFLFIRSRLLDIRERNESDVSELLRAVPE